MPFKLNFYPNNPYTECEEDIPLFHYTQIESLISILKNKSIRFRKSNYSNDPQDGEMLPLIAEAIDAVDSRLSLVNSSVWCAYKNLCGNNQLFLEKFTLDKNHSFDKSQFPSMFNFCHSRVSNNENLWQDYEHNKVCIEFSEHFIRRALDYPTPLNMHKYTDASSSNIVYNHKDQIYILKTIIINSFIKYENHFSSGKANECKDTLLSTFSDFQLCSYIFKNETTWCHEKEYRFFLIWRLGHSLPPNTDEPDKPYIELSFADNPAIWDKIINKILVRNLAAQKKLNDFGIFPEIV
jgi:hypothetical protein